MPAGKDIPITERRTVEFKTILFHQLDVELELGARRELDRRDDETGAWPSYDGGLLQVATAVGVDDGQR